MILTIKGADFSLANIGTLSTYIISKSIGSGATFDIPNFVDKNSSVNWTITLDEGYTFGTYSVTMGGEVITPTVVDNVMTISIVEVTGNVRIVVATVNENTGEEDIPVVPPVEPDEPTDGEENITDLFTWQSGACKWSDGSVIIESNWMVSNAVPIAKYENIRLSAIQTPTNPTMLGYAFYDASNKRISGASNSGASYEPIEKILPVPQNAVYFRAMWISENSTNYDNSIHDISKFYCYGDINENYVEPEIPEIPKGEYDDLEEGQETNLTSKFNWTPGTIAASSGAKTNTDTNWTYSNDINVEGLSKLRFSHIQTPNKQTSLGYSFLNESHKVVGYEINGGESYAPVEKTIDVPANAKYFRCMWINTSNENYNEEIHNVENFYCYGIK